MPKPNESLYPEPLMIDAVKYGDEKGDKDASVQFGVAIAMIRSWRQMFSKLPSKPQYQRMKSPTEKTSQEADNVQTTATTSPVEENGVRLNNESPPVQTDTTQNAQAATNTSSSDETTEDEKTLADWLEERMSKNHFPTLMQMADQAKRMNLNNSLCHKNRIHSFLHKMGIHQRWHIGAIRRYSKHKDNNLNEASYTTASTTTMARSSVLPSKKKPMSNDGMLENLLVDWIRRRLDRDQRPALKEIGMKWQKITCQHKVRIKPIKNPSSWGEKFLKRTELESRWREMLYMTKNQQKSNESVKGLPDQATLSPSSPRDDHLKKQMSDKLENRINTDAASSSCNLTRTGYQDHVAVQSVKKVMRGEPDDSMINCRKRSPDTKLMELGKRRCMVNLKQQHLMEQGFIKSTSEPVVIKRGFGSFHFSNLKEQLRFAESASYVPVELPVRAPTFDEYTNSDCKFGSTVQKKHFLLEQGCVFLNHGSFGAMLKEVLDYYHDWQRYVESQPVRFFKRVLSPQVVHVQKRLADFIGCKASEITFITNVTTAINAVLQGLKLSEDNSSIYYLSLTCDAVKKIIKHICERTGAKAIEVPVTLPLSKPEDIVSLVQSTLKITTTLAIFDHVPSDYAFIMPIRELVSLCHQRGVQVLIDGAHGLGQVHLDLSILGADYYVGDCHKWFCSPKGCAFMYVNKQLQRLTRGLIISHGYDEGFHSQFVWTGMKDYSSYLSLHALINFWTTVGPNNIREYCKSLLKDAAEYFMSKWDVELLAPIENHGMMCCISLPSVLFSGKDVSYDDAEAIQNRLYSDFKIEVPIKCIGNKLYVRISAHIYNEFSEYATLASAILQIANAV